MSFGLEVVVVLLAVSIGYSTSTHSLLPAAKLSQNPDWFWTLPRTHGHPRCCELAPHLGSSLGPGRDWDQIAPHLLTLMIADNYLHKDGTEGLPIRNWNWCRKHQHTPTLILRERVHLHHSVVNRKLITAIKSMPGRPKVRFSASFRRHLRPTRGWSIGFGPPH